MVLSVEIGIIPWIPCNGYTWQWFLMTHDWLYVTLSGEVGMIFSQADLMISLGDDLLGQEMKLPKTQTLRTKVRINKTNSPFQSPFLEVPGQFGGLGRHSSINPLVLKGLSNAQLSHLILSVCMWNCISSQQLKHVHHWQLRILTCCQFRWYSPWNWNLNQHLRSGRIWLISPPIYWIVQWFWVLISFPHPSKRTKI